MAIATFQLVNLSTSQLFNLSTFNPSTLQPFTPSTLHPARTFSPGRRFHATAMPKSHIMHFTTSYEEILQMITRVDPVKYCSTRNFINGAVTRLSPYISRGVISTRQMLDGVMARGYEPQQIEKFIQELCWRDYWQQVWIANKTKIDTDLKNPQPLASREGIPSNMLLHQTGIVAIDKGIQDLYATGYMHNHLRMYVASLACNVARNHWRIPAQWMYYHLLDGDWASNALSWQWVCGANSKKLYYANQENINKYCDTDQHDTFLDIEYERFAQIKIPSTLEMVATPLLTTTLPETNVPAIDPDLPTLIYNFYNLDPAWRGDMKANRVMLLEPSVFEKYPVSKRSIDFAIQLAKENIPGVKIWVAEFAALQSISQSAIYFKEHPLNSYLGIEDARTWMTSVKGDFPSFFAYWKKCKKELFTNNQKSGLQA